ncbi:hypothetical protein [Micromonospora sp. CB01531]|uniref:hypothetical protein n=1 Tax=Micromonospora sp. CB01531 TaxID=1718947 RepID=UPI00093B6F38|nr:hypothetical protein [Micromonospora sp. CB01531]OKI47214.1 hypothetical protein A6A27_10205 [Micromonospora sp. CB01531]
MIRRLLLAASAAYVTLAAAILGLSAALDIHWDPQMAVVEAVAAVFLGQYLLVAYLLTRRPR